MSSFLYTLMHPALYHHGKKPPFFEGWYYKLISADESIRCAVIPAVILGEHGHAFIQVADSVSGRMEYYSFPLSEFWASKKDFEVRIADNKFTLDGFSLNLHADSGQTVTGQVHLHGTRPWPVTLFSPGIMGWYAWVPSMECYHGVLSLDHALSGSLNFGDRLADFSAGRGYLEKDWGASFPEGYVWMQTNHFDRPGISLIASVAVIPWRGSAFPGFILGFLLDGKLHRFATYTGARLEVLELTPEHVWITVSDRQQRLELRAERAEGIPLKGPTKRDMGARVDESLSARVHVRLSSRRGHTLFEGVGRNAGLEIFEVARLLEMVKAAGK
jgi:tocopherol cyclase